MSWIDWTIVFVYLVGILYMGWWSLAVALVVAAWSEQTDLVEHIWPPMSYMYLPICGFFYLAVVDFQMRQA